MPGKKQDDAGHFGAWTLNEIGDVLGVTREAVRQVEKKALRKLAARLASEGKTLADLLPDGES